MLVGPALMGLSFLQRPGDTTFDTKFDLSAAPGPFLARTLHLWNPQASFGELQNQAYGYLFPQGGFFLLGDLLQLPDWVVQRLWSGLLLVVGFEGTRRLWLAVVARSTSRDRWAAVAAGLGYATAPRLLGLSGVLSAEVLPTAVLPWCLLPLALFRAGRMGPGTAAAASGLAVLFFGGVNAVENLAALPLPFLLAASLWRAPHGRRLLVLWLAAVGAASLWWLLPLLVLGRYSPPFLDYIEVSAAVVRPLGWTNVTRGADHWLAFIDSGGQPWWPGARDLATSPHLIALTALVAAVGFAGLATRSMPWRGPLVASSLLGLVCLTLARGGVLASPVQETVQQLLDGPLSMLRNVHKVDPLVRLPLALGLAHVVGLLLARPAAESGWRRLRAPVALGLVLAAVVAAAQPLYTDRLRKPGWERVPGAWHEAADYLAEHSEGRAALVLPGSGFGQQWWGWTIDEPLQGLARSRWVSRSQVPLAPGPTIRFLDAIEERVQDGVGSPMLAEVLARSGVGHVLVRRDLDLYATSSPAPARVDQALARTPGLEKVASFGSSGFGEQAMIDVYRVDREVPVAEAVALSGVRRLAGGPEDVITALEAGALDPDEPVVVGGAPGADGGVPDVVGDGYRHRERQFGRLHDSVSQMMTRDEPYRYRRAAHDYPGVPGAPRVHAEYDDVRSVTASTAGGYADTLGRVRPELGPFSAVDGVTETYWQSAPYSGAVGQWVEVELTDPTPVTRVDVVAAVDGFTGVPVREVQVEAGGTSRRVPVDPATGAARVELPSDPVTRVRVTVTEVAGGDESSVVALREIEIAGVDVARRLVVPDAGADADTTFVLRARPHRRACLHTGIGVTCDADEGRPSEEERGMARRLSVAEPVSWTVSGWVVARPRPATRVLLEPIDGRVRVRSSSVLGDEPGVAPQLAYDGDPRTAWVAARGAESPTLRLSWDRPRPIGGLQVVGAGGGTATPGTAVLEAAGRTWTVQVGPSSFGVFPPVVTRRLRITFPQAEVPDRRRAPVGVGELTIQGLQGRRHAIDRRAPTGAVCGLGPELVIDGRVHRTRVDGTLADVLDGTPLRWRPCGGPIRVAGGPHEVHVVSTEQFAPTLVTLRPSDAASPQPPVTRREVTVTGWTEVSRTLTVGAGPEAVLRVPENVNPGWEARLEGRRLEPTAVDGWQQGYLLPAGAGGSVTLTFRPDGPYRAALAVGGLAAAALAVVTVLVLLRGRCRRDPSGPPPAATPGADAPSVTPRRARTTTALALLAGYLLAGPAVAAGLAAAAFGRARLPMAGLVGLPVAAAGVVAAVAAARSGGLPPVAADVLAGFAVGALAATLLRRAGAP